MAYEYIVSQKNHNSDFCYELLFIIIIEYLWI